MVTSGAICAFAVDHQHALERTENSSDHRRYPAQKLPLMIMCRRAEHEKNFKQIVLVVITRFAVDPQVALPQLMRAPDH